MSDLKDTYNKIAEDWYKDHHEDTWWTEGTDKFISMLNTGDRVLDVGCGAGVKSKYLSQKGLNVLGTDFSESMVEIAKREVPEATFQVGDIHNMSDILGMFDGVFAQAVLLHIPKKEIPSVIEELKSKIKDEGYLYVAVKGRKLNGEEEEVLEESDYGYTYNRFFSYFTLEEMKDYLGSTKMNICYENVSLVGSTDWIQIIAQK